MVLTIGAMLLLLFSTRYHLAVLHIFAIGNTYFSQRSCNCVDDRLGSEIRYKEPIHSILSWSFVGLCPILKNLVNLVMTPSLR
jgi:hypothetical protein